MLARWSCPLRPANACGRHIRAARSRGSSLKSALGRDMSRGVSPAPHPISGPVSGRCRVIPRVVGDFEHSAGLETFAAGGLGVFPAPEL
jgi:hypothetical protein